MKLGMINSAWEQHGIDLLSGLERTKEIGFDCVDIFQDPLDPGAAERVTDERIEPGCNCEASVRGHHDVASAASGLPLSSR